MNTNIEQILRSMMPCISQSDFKRKLDWHSYNRKVEGVVNQITHAVKASFSQTNGDMGDNACLLSEAIRLEIEKTKKDYDAHIDSMAQRADMTACDMMAESAYRQEVADARCWPADPFPEGHHDNDHDGLG